MSVQPFLTVTALLVVTNVDLGVCVCWLEQCCLTPLETLWWPDDATLLMEPEFLLPIQKQNPLRWTLSFLDKPSLWPPIRF